MSRIDPVRLEEDLEGVASSLAHELPDHQGLRHQKQRRLERSSGEEMKPEEFDVDTLTPKETTSHPRGRLSFLKRKIGPQSSTSFESDLPTLWPTWPMYFLGDKNTPQISQLVPAASRGVSLPQPVHRLSTTLGTPSHRSRDHQPGCQRWGSRAVNPARPSSKLSVQHPVAVGSQQSSVIIFETSGGMI